MTAPLIDYVWRTLPLVQRAARWPRNPEVAASIGLNLLNPPPPPLSTQQCVWGARNAGRVWWGNVWVAPTSSKMPPVGLKEYAKRPPQGDLESTVWLHSVRMKFNIRTYIRKSFRQQCCEQVIAGLHVYVCIIK